MDDQVTGRLGNELHTILLIKFHQLSETFTNDIFDSKSVLVSVWDLEEHGGGQEDTVQELKADLEMWRHEPLFLFNLIFDRFLNVSVVGASLSQAFL